MKKLLIVTGIAMGIFVACNQDGEDPVKESCIDGIQNQDETGVDCGGKCIECFDCFSSYCEYLSGGVFSDPNSTIKWKCTRLDGQPFVPDTKDQTQVLLSALLFTFSNKGTLVRVTLAGEMEGRWSFDNPENPAELFFLFEDTTFNSSLEISSLIEDELDLVWYEGAIATFEPTP